MKSRIILPLDVDSYTDALDVVERIDPASIWGVKVNSLAALCSMSLIDDLKHKLGFNVMADPKLYDIPSTNQRNLENLIDLGADIVTVHVGSMWQPRGSYQLGRIAGVTVLTSFDQCLLNQKYPNGLGYTIENRVKTLAKIAENLGYEYLVCSAADLKWVKEELKYDENMSKICPGIRPSWYTKKDDQSRVMTPGKAIEAGADLLVIGRPILNYLDIQEAIDRTNEEINNALKSN